MAEMHKSDMVTNWLCGLRFLKVNLHFAAIQMQIIQVDSVFAKKVIMKKKLGAFVQPHQVYKRNFS